MVGVRSPFNRYLVLLWEREREEMPIMPGETPVVVMHRRVGFCRGGLAEGWGEVYLFGIR